MEVLRRLAPHDLAVSRCVCKPWRDAIDDHLRSQLLSRSVRGIFINYAKHTMSEFFSRPSTGPAICGGLDCLPCEGAKVTDHCNGLVLCRDWVALLQKCLLVAHQIGFLWRIRQIAGCGTEFSPQKFIL